MPQRLTRSRRSLGLGLSTFLLLACASPEPATRPPVLLFAGTGASANDVAALEASLSRDQLRYLRVTSRQLDSLGEAGLASFRLLIVPGGDFLAMGRGLAPETLHHVHNAVGRGLNYLGICAGGFLAGSASYPSFSLAPAQFGFYAASAQGLRKAVVPIATVGHRPVEHYWEDGPEFSGWGAVVGRYPDATPAVVEGRSGEGWVFLSGVHPEAPSAWRRGMPFEEGPDSANAFADTLMAAAVRGTPLPHY